jgi:Tfp pilus assembly protein PilO
MRLDKNDISGFLPSVLVILIFAVGVIAFYFFSPSAQSLRVNQNQASDLEKEIDLIKEKELPGLRKKQAVLSEIEESYQKFMENIWNAEKKLPLKEELGFFLEQLFLSAKESEVDFFLIKLKKEVEFKDYVQLPVEIEIRSDFLKLGKYLEKIEGMQRITTIDRLDIKRVGKSQSLVEAEVFALTYVLKK